MSNKKNAAWGTIEYGNNADDDNFVSKSTDHYKQRTLSPRERVLSPESPVKKSRKKTQLKTSIHSAKNKRSKTISTQTHFDAPSLISPLKMQVECDFPTGSIVGINGCDLDYGRFKVKRDAPMFYGLVEDTIMHDGEDELVELKEDEVIVKFVVCGEYEWYDKNVPNCLVSNYKKSLLVLCHPPPVNVVGADLFASDDDSVRWFTKSRSGWVVKVFEDPCYGCGSPYCLYHENRTALRTMLSDFLSNRRMSNKQKRYRCYRDAISMKWGTLGHASRKRVGWCWENKCRVVFPEQDGIYTGFKKE